MEKMPLGRFAAFLDNKIQHYPLSGQIELTYRCNLKCIHCYCQGSEDANRELTTKEWKGLLDVMQKEGCLYLCITGGEPLIRDDFLELYSYAKAKGFIITLFTNGLLLTEKIIDYLVKSPPFSIEITLNGITKRTYESVTRVPGSFLKVMKAVNILKEKKLPFVLKTNCLKQNKQEVGRVKAFTEELFSGLRRNKYRFKYDPMIHPRLNQDKTPTNYRLSFREISGVRKQDTDIWEEYQKGLKCGFHRPRRARGLLYHCNSWLRGFFIDPFGRMKFCNMSYKFSADLETTPFKEVFYGIFPKLLAEKFRTGSKCINCKLRPFCYRCPARAYLETGDEEAPVPYYCELAEALAKEWSVYPGFKQRKSAAAAQLR